MEAEKQELQVINEPQPSPKNQVTEADTLKQPQDQNPQDGTLPVKKEDKPSAEHYEESPYRFYVVVAYFLLTFANGFQWVTFSSCADNFGTAYDMPSWKVNMFSLIYMIIYPFVCIPQGYLVDAYSTRLGLIIAAACTFLGAGLKLLVNKSMACVFIGQILAGLFQPAILNSPGKIAANWFRVNVRTLITTICCISDTIGILVGFVFHCIIIDDKLDPELNRDEYKDDFYNYIFWEFIVNLVFCLPTFFIFYNKPKYPPSPSQAEVEKPPLLESLKLLFTNIRFIYLLIATCFVVGYYDVYGTILNSYLALYDISDNQASYIYAVSSAVGIVASIIISALLDKYKKFKLFMIVLVILGTIFQALFTILLEVSLHHESLNQYAIGMVLYTLVTAILIPFYTIGMNYACEITYPVGESINGGIMMTMSQISGIAGTFGCDALINDYEDAKYASNVVLLIFFVIACVFVFLFDEKLERYEVDKAGMKKEIGDGKENTLPKEEGNNKEGTNTPPEQQEQNVSPSPEQQMV